MNAKNTINDQLVKAKIELGILNKEYCLGEECKEFSKMEQLPEGVYKGHVYEEYYRVSENDNETKEKIKELNALNTIIYLKTIKNYLLIIVYIAVVFLLLTFVLFNFN